MAQSIACVEHGVDGTQIQVIQLTSGLDFVWKYED